MAESKANKKLEEEYDKEIDRIKKYLKKEEKWSGKSEDFYHWKTIFIMGNERVMKYFKKESMKLEEFDVDSEANLKKFLVIFRSTISIWREAGKGLVELLPKDIAQNALQQEKWKREEVMESVTVAEDQKQAIIDAIPETSEYPHPYTMFKYVCDQVESLTRTEKHSLKREFHALKCEGPTPQDFETFVGKIGLYSDKLASIDCTPDDDDKLTILLSGLPRKYNTLKNNLEHGEKTFTECVLALRCEFRDNQHDYEQRSEEKKDKEKSKRPKPKDENIMAVQEQERPRCFHCKAIGHTVDKCWIKNPDLKPKGSRDTTSHQTLNHYSNRHARGGFRYRSNVAECTTCKRRHPGKCHVEIYLEGQKNKKNNEHNEAKVLQEERNGDDNSDDEACQLQLRVMRSKESKQEKKQLNMVYQLDSAADIHVTGNEDLLDQVQDIEPKSIGGFSTDAPKDICSKKGSVKIHVRVGNLLKKVNISDVHYLPSVKRNVMLISLGQLANIGVRHDGDSRQGPNERDLTHKLMKDGEVIMEGIQRKGSTRTYLRINEDKQRVCATRVENQVPIELIPNNKPITSHRTKQSRTGLG